MTSSATSPAADATITWQGIKEQFAAALTASDKELVYCGGTIQVAPNDLILLYGDDEDLKRIPLATATPQQVEALANACTKATFGMNKNDVLDETYRKAGKMDADKFALNFNPASTGIIDRIKQALFSLEPTPRNIRAELYKLNVYGPGSFFKSHVDTPRGGNMFGSVVVVLPTPHEGGELYLRHANKEWIFDSAKELSARSDKNSVGYVAFYSDVEHEVKEITSGYRVTITYNLYFDDSVQRPPTPGIDDPSAQLFSQLLSQSDFLPEGGLVGFGLTHKYPLPELRGEYGRSAPLKPLLSCLKGVDATILHHVRRSGLKPRLYVVYNCEGECAEVLCQEIVEFDCGSDEFSLVEGLIEKKGIVITWDVTEDWDREQLEDKMETWPAKEVTWILPQTNVNKVTSVYPAYGNHISLDYFYGNIALVVEVGKPGERTSVTLGLEDSETGSDDSEMDSGDSE